MIIMNYNNYIYSNIYTGKANLKRKSKICKRSTEIFFDSH